MPNSNKANFIYKIPTCVNVEIRTNAAQALQGAKTVESKFN